MVAAPASLTSSSAASRLPDDAAFSGVNGSVIDGMQAAPTVPSAALLQYGTYSRVGNDLVIHGPAGEQVVVDNYFHGKVPPTLHAPGGLELSGKTVLALAGEHVQVQVADASGMQQLAQAASPIGTADKLTGTVTVTRTDGTVSILQSGDVVYQGDVLQTADGSSIGLVMADGTELSLGSKGRIVLDEMVYDAGNGTGHSSVSLVSGVFSFVSGQIAKSSPDGMQIKTPVATIGIRGTSGTIQLGDLALDNDSQIRVILIPDPNGTVGEIQITTMDGRTSTLNTAFNGLNIGQSTLQSFSMTVHDFVGQYGSVIQGLRSDFSSSLGPINNTAPEQNNTPQNNTPTPGENKGSDASGTETDGTQQASSSSSTDTSQSTTDSSSAPIKVVLTDTIVTKSTSSAFSTSTSDGDGDGQTGSSTASSSSSSTSTGQGSSSSTSTSSFSTTDNSLNTTTITTTNGSSGSTTGSGSSGGSSSSVSYSGSVIDPHVSGATVFIDYDGDSVLDSNEPYAITASDGSYSLTDSLGKGGQVVSIGGVDTVTGLSIGTLVAPSGSSTVTPLTTLMQNLISSGAASSASQAQSLVASALGLNLSSIDLTNYDPVSQLGGSSASQASLILSTGVMVQNVVAMITATLVGAGASESSALDAAFSALATAMDGASGRSFLQDASAIASIISDAASDSSLSGTLDASKVAAAQDAVAQTISSLSAAMESIISSGGSAASLLEDLSAAARVAQRDAQADIAAAVADGTSGALGETYSSSGIASRLAQARDEPVSTSGPIEGTSGNDTLTGTSGADEIQGNDGNDWLSGKAGNDRLYGGNGNDTLLGGVGNDVLNGGSGTDTADYSDNSAALTVNLATGTASGTEAGTDTLTSIEVVIGGSGDDTFIGGSGVETLHGGAGNDTFDASGGNDVLNGGAGTDTLDFSAISAAVTVNLLTGTASSTATGSDTLSAIEVVIGGSGDDTFIGGSGVETLYGGAGNDTFIASTRDDVFDGGDGIDTLDFSALTTTVNVDYTTHIASSGITGFDTLSSIEVVIGGSGNDTFIGGSGAETFYGGVGADTFIASAGDDVLDGGTDILSRDSVDYSAVQTTLTVTGSGSSAIASSTETGTDQLTAMEVLISGSGNDTFSGGGIATIHGGAGNDTFIASAGYQWLDGGDGEDVLDYSALTGNLTVNLKGGVISGSVYSALTGLTSVVSFETIIGGSGDDTFTGDRFHNTLIAGAGNDTFIGSAAGDFLDGGDGIDTVDFTSVAETSASTTSNRYTTITVNLATGMASGIAIGDTTLVSIEKVIGGGGDDVFIGSSGNETFSGGDGADTFIASAGDDVLDGGRGMDTVDYSAVSSSLVVNTTTGIASSSETGTDTLTAIDNVIGGSGNDTFIGYSSVDTFHGGAGDDTFIASRGSDVLDGGDGTDVVDYSAFSTAIDVNFLTGKAIGTEISTDTLSSIEVVIGGSGNDTFTGGSGSETLYGGAGNDTFIASAGNDVLNGGAGRDTLTFSAVSAAVTVNLATGVAFGTATGTDTVSSIETVIGGSGNDTFIGSTANETFTGGAGNDTFIVSAGNDVFNGGTGIDTLDFSAVSTAVAVNLATGAAASAATGNSTLTSIEVVIGGSGDDTFVGGSGVETFHGGAGNDTFFGSAGDDVLDGGDGIDTVDYRYAGSNVGLDHLISIEIVLGSDGDDTFTGGSSIGTLYGGLGNDTFYNVGGDTFYDGGLGIDMLNLGAFTTAVSVNLATGIAFNAVTGTSTLASIEAVIGGSGNDTLAGGSHDETLSGGAGDDTLVASAGDDTLNGGDGVDTLDFSGVSSAVTVNLDTAVVSGVLIGSATSDETGTDRLTSIEVVIGGSGDDTFTGSYRSGETFHGGAGNDTFIASGGSDVLDGGDGIDTLDYSGGSTGVTVNLATGTASSSTTGSYGLSSIEAVIGSRGNDTFISSAGNDTLNGGQGTDTVDFSGTSAAVTVNFLSGVAVSAETGTDSLTSIEVVIGTASDDTFIGGSGVEMLYGGAGNDTFTASASWDTIFGGDGIDTFDLSSISTATTVNLTTGIASGSAIDQDTLSSIEVVIGGSGNDTMTGSGASDTFHGGTGNDTFIGSAGNDVLDGGEGTDTANYSAVTAAMTINLATGVASSTATGSDTLTSIEEVIGGSGDDTFIGGSGAETFSGGAGNDTFIASAGDDVLAGGAGTDTADFSGIKADLTVNLLTGVAVSAETGTDSLYTIENVIGGSGNDTLTGSSSADTLFGADGNDTLVGNGGTDVLLGGAGNDTLTYTGSEQGMDGGDGTDRLLLAAGSSVALTNLIGVVSNIEIIDLGNSEATLTVVASDVSALIGDNDWFIVDGGSSDVLALTGEWIIGDSVTVDGVSYDSYVQDGTQILVGQDVSVEQIIPTVGEILNVEGSSVLAGTYIHLGIGSDGYLGVGSSVVAETGWETARGGLSMAADVDGFDHGSLSQTGDYFLPGTPVEGYSIGYVTTSGTTTLTAHYADSAVINGTTSAEIDGTDLVATTTATSSNGALSINQVITLGSDATYYTTTVTLTNLTDSTLSSVRYMRNADPDMDHDTYNTFNSLNDVLANPSNTGVAAVQASGPVSGGHVLYFSDSSSARASANGFENTNPYASDVYDSPSDPNGTSNDVGINLVIDAGTLAPGASVTISYVTSLNEATNGHDFLVGTSGNTVLDGGNGNDTLWGLTGADTLLGGNGSDTLIGGSDNDLLTGGYGPDTFLFTAGVGATTADRITSLGTDVISDFTHNVDQVVLDGDTFNLSETFAYLEQNASLGSTAVSFGEGSGVIVVGSDSGGGGVELWFTTDSSAATTSNSYQIATLQNTDLSTISQSDIHVG